MRLMELLERLCDDRISEAEMKSLEKLLSESEPARKIYLQYIELHGLLSWDLAKGEVIPSGRGGGVSPLLPATIPPAELIDSVGVLAPRPQVVPRPTNKPTRLLVSLASVAALILGMVAFWNFQQPSDSPNLTDNQPEQKNPEQTSPREPVRIANSPLHMGTNNNPNETIPDRQDQEPDREEVLKPDDQNSKVSNNFASERTVPRSQSEIVAWINGQLEAVWKTHGLSPSPRADDSEWLRRVYLDLTGHIPPLEVVEKFLADKTPEKRSVLLDELLDDSRFPRYFANLWANLLVGQKDNPNINRPALEAFLRQSFARNRPFNEVVYDLLAAEGKANENGAVNFLAAHLNDQAIPATAAVSRLFLGQQIQCAQCHEHPDTDWQQARFWELNSFFLQTEIKRHNYYDAATGESKLRTIELVTNDRDEGVFFETRQGLLKVAYPTLQGKAVVSSSNRRRELARLIAEPGSPLSPALINRFWGHFLGHGFTPRVDDMGPHVSASHPELLKGISEQFERNRYDVKQLIRWICLSEAYQRSSRRPDQNNSDDPESGSPPLFSYAYMKPLSAEQVFDSVVVASSGVESRKIDWQAIAQERNEWLSQFVIPLENEENCEQSSFDGSIPQSLALMNGEIVTSAIQKGRSMLSGKSSEDQKISQIFLATLSRYPSEQELSAVRKMTRKSRGNPAESLEDIYWACLNSSEFVLNH